MPVVARSKTWLRQSHSLVASPGDGEGNCLRRVVESRQRNAVVARHEKVGSPSPTCAVANGSQSTLGFRIFKCKYKTCLTCPKYITEHKFKSNKTQKNYNITNHSRIKITCHTQNVVYLLSCNQCNVQYASETALPLHKRINLHRRAKSGCENDIKYFKDVCIGASFPVKPLRYSLILDTRTTRCVQLTEKLS